ncbi:MAG: TonB-dependent receptor plug domain-containing protein [Kiritimatiellia bacterium]
MKTEYSIFNIQHSIIKCWAVVLGVALGLPAGAQEPVSPTFALGEVLVVGAEDAGGDGTAASVAGEQADRAGRRNVAEAAALAPGVTLTRIGGRNEAAAYVRGFDTRQVPLFIDGIPVYVPYDGNVDMGRFDAFDLGELSIAKGYSPAIYGPNTLGGAINVVSLRPTQPEEVVARAGVASGETVEGALRAGILRPAGYAQAGISSRERDHFRVADDYEPTATEDGGRRGNSDARDLQVRAKIAWTPGDQGDEFAVGFVRQDSEKGVPVYAGTDTNTLPRYWRYAEWLKNSLYAVGHVHLGQTGYLKPRFYYDTYENVLKAYDDATYATQTKKSSFTSVYDDYAFGGSVEGGLRAGERHDLRAAAHYKQDVHREHDVGGPTSTFKDETGALGAEDRIALAEKWSLALGAEAAARNSLEAEDANTGAEFADNDNAAFNPQAGLFYAVTGGTFRATIARKSRFPTLKDRYSYRLGKALANPDLDPETALHGEIGYRGRILDNLDGHLSGFYSRLDDTIQQVDRVAQDDEEAWLYQLRNVGESENLGAEAGLAWTIVPDLKAGCDYMYLHRRNLDNPEIKLTDSPEHSWKAYVEWQAGARLTLAPNVEYNSSRYSSSVGTKAAGFWLANLDAQLALPRGFGLAAGIRNVFDENYELGEGYPEEGRSFYASVQYRF